MEEVVVTGSITPEKKIESSTSISTLTTQEMNDAAPRSTTEFLPRPILPRRFIAEASYEF